MQHDIVLVLVDQWRGDHLGHLGHPLVHTPFTDQLAAEGWSCARAYSPSPSCIPARACLATGLSPWRCGRIGYQDGQPWPYQGTMQERLRQAGWQTVQVGKTHFHPHRLHLGFEVNDLYEASRREPGFVSDYHAWLAERAPTVRDTALDRDPNSWVVSPWVADEHLHPSTWIADQALARLTRRDPTRPLFLQIGMHRPHPPFDPPSRWWSRFAGVELPPPALGDWVDEPRPVTAASWTAGRARQRDLDDARRAYLALIAHVDEQIGRLVFALRAAGRLDRTWIIVTADHGMALGDHHRLHKGTPFEGSARIPLVIRPPGGAAGPGRVSAAPAQLTDLMPSVLAMAGLPVPEGLDGCDLTPQVRGAEAAPRTVHIEHHDQQHGWQALCDGRWKYVRDGVTGRELLFDLAADPGERRDLSAQGTADWQARLAGVLAARGDGLVVDGRLSTGVRLPRTAEWLKMQP